MTGTDDLRRLAKYIDKWRLALEGEPFATPSSLIAYVRAPQGPAVLKLFNPNSDEASSPLALAHYSSHGAVRVMAHDENAMLLERAVPGTPLAELVARGRDEEATRILCDVAAQLHASAAPPSPWLTVEEWGQGFARYRRGPQSRHLPTPLIDEAEGQFFELCRTQTKRVLLHGDLHHFNILYDRRRGWLAIDPKGVVGEPAYETGAALRNPIGSEVVYTDEAVMTRRVETMCKRLSLSRPRVLGWCFAQAVLSTIWWYEDGGDLTVPGSGLLVAKTARRLWETWGN